MMQEPRCSERRCKHYLGVWNPTPDDEGGERNICHAFMDRIPAEIAYGDNLHEKPLPRQGNEIVFEPLAEGEDFPEREGEGDA